MARLCLFKSYKEENFGPLPIDRASPKTRNKQIKKHE